ncbi:MAG TPA: carboxypeptidase-like regulatory domain-containing protein [Polyangiaceae bacterium]
MRSIVLGSVFALTVPFASGCGDDEPPPKEEKAECSTTTGEGCDAGFVCEEVEGGKAACFAPLIVSGRVFDLSNDDGIEGATVVARDANGAAVSSVAVSDADGNYELRVPAKRVSGGGIAASNVTLRADASGFLTFPRAPRVALPLDLSEATGDPPELASTLTDVGLIPLGAGDRGTISGHVLAENPGGTLVVAGGATGIADREGEYTVFNVPAGTQTVEGYLPGVNLESESVEVAANAEETGVDLDVVSDASATVSGNVQLVNAPGGSETSVILVVESTFDETMARGEAPPGLRAGDVSGAWSIENVPNGRYVALAAFENDGLVRDPDTSIGGTEIVHVEVTGADVSLSDGFKVTGALAVESPGATEPETVTMPFDLSWEDDSSEDSYDLTVFDALGAVTWEQTGIMGPRGNAPVVVTYAGPPLEPGMFYQFRAVSIKDGVPISATEDLKGVFTVE